MALTVLSNRLLSDGHSPDLQDGAHVVIQGGRIREVSQGAVPKGERVIDQGRRRMYLGGKSLYWPIAFRDDKPGAIEVRWARDGTRAWMSTVGEYYPSLNGEYGGL